MLCFLFCGLYALNDLFLNDIFKKKLTPCDCVQSFIANDLSKAQDCERYFNSLSRDEQDIWVDKIGNCEGGKSQEFQKKSTSLPSEIQEKIDRVNELNVKLQSIPDAQDIFSNEALELAKQKIDLINPMLELAEEIERAGYSNEIPNYDGFMSSIRLEYSGLKLHQEGLLEMSQNGTINSGQSSTNYDNNSNTGNKVLSNNIDEFLNKEESYLEIKALEYDKARSDYFNAGKGNYAQLRNEITNDYYPKKKSELESFYLQNSSNFNNDQLKRYGKLKRSLENLFRNAFETN
jgi:hypothetical protein